MLKLRDIFLRKLALVFSVLFLILGASLYVWIKDIYIVQTKKELLHNIEIFAIGQTSLEQIENHIQAIKHNTGIRVTIIDLKGKVIAESNGNKSTMDNHQYRDEIIAAKTDPYGYSIRYSHTLDKELLYVAKEISLNGTVYFVRMAKDIDTIMGTFWALSFKTALLFGLFGLFAYWKITGISTDIQRETERILNFLDDMGNKEKNRSITSHYSIEFYKMTKLLTETSRKLTKRRKQKSKYTTRLKLSNRQKDDIISAISHEFKNPITVIDGYSQTLIEDSSLSPQITKKFLQKIHTNTHKLTHMINRLRLFIRLDEQKQEIRIKACDIVTLIHEVIETLQISYPDREIAFIAPSSLIIQADETLMEIAIINLIENAIKYSEDTPITISLDTKSLKITDQGIGIAPKEIEKITKKFYRVEGNSWNNSMGIGLSLVSTIINMHHFTLNIQSQVGSGSTFEIRFNS